MIELLDPTREIGSGRMVYASRPSSLKGKTVGLIENTKYNSDRLLEMIGQILVDEYGVAKTKLYHKHYSSVPAHEEIITDVRNTCDFMIAGVGDCGSCSSGSGVGSPGPGYSRRRISWRWPPASRSGFAAVAGRACG